MLKSEKNPITTGQLPDRRAYPRVPIRSVAYIELDDDNAGLILNISEGGIGVQSAEMITGDRFERMILRLPKLEKWIEASGRLAWISQSRKEAGIHFVDLSEDARQQIQSWIHSFSSRSGVPVDQGRFKIVWESEEQEISPAGPALKDDPADIEAMFPSEKVLPPTRRARVDNDSSVAVPSLELGIAPGPVKRQVVPSPVPPSVEPAPSEQNSAPGVVSSLSPPSKEKGNSERRSYHYPPVVTDPKPSGDPFASIAQDTVVVAPTISTASSANSANPAPPRTTGPNEPITPAFPLREHYRGLGYNPTPFEEPSGKGWLIAATVLIVLLGVGAVMAIGPNNVKATLSRHLAAISNSGPPPPAGATDKSQEAVATNEDSSNSASFGGAPQPPLTNPDVDATQKSDAPPAQAKEPAQIEVPPTTTTVTGKVSSRPPVNDTGTIDTSAQNLSVREASPDETQEDAAAITRRFQMEHSGANFHNTTNSYPAPAYQAPGASRDAQSGIPSNGVTSAAPTPPAPQTKPDRAVEAYSQPVPPSPAPSSVSSSPNAAGTVAVSSHFRSLRGEDPEATREREGLAIGQLIAIHQPIYPVEAERSRTEGIVQLRATVDQLGKVEIVHAVSGPPLLLAAAIDAVREWRYAPTTVNGKAVESVNDVNVVFRLSNSAASPR